MAPRFAACVVRCGMLLALALAAGCMHPGRPPVVERSPVFSTPAEGYLVHPGDTLYSIAWRFEMDYRTLARINGLSSPYTIRTGQRIRLQPPPERAQSPRARPPVAEPRAAEPARSPAPKAPAPSPRPAVAGWRTPTDAPVRRGYGNGNWGIDYGLGPAHAVGAAAPGEVVYAGSGLGGYRHLVIVKHDPEHLSAYSFDRSPTVREGQKVAGGEALAEGGRAAGVLHFEIRRRGEPVDPRGLIGR